MIFRLMGAETGSSQTGQGPSRQQWRRLSRHEGTKTRRVRHKGFLRGFAKTREYNPHVPRNAEVIRQWTILRAIEKARAGGVDDRRSRVALRGHDAARSAATCRRSRKRASRSTTTSRRRWADAVAGQRPGVQGTGGGADVVGAVRALHFSRTLVESLSGTPFRDDVETAFDKLSSVLTPHMRQFLDQLPRRHLDEARSAAPARERRSPPAAGRRARARGHAAPAAGDDHLSLEIERPHEVLSRASLPARVRAGRAVSAGLRARNTARSGRSRSNGFRSCRCSRSASRRSRNCPTRRFRIRSACIPARPSAWRSNFSPRSPTTSGRASGIRRRPSTSPLAACA